MQAGAESMISRLTHHGRGGSLAEKDTWATPFG